MKNEGKNERTNDHIKELLYIEMVQQQMKTFTEIDVLLESKSDKSMVPKSEVSENNN